MLLTFQAVHGNPFDELLLENKEQYRRHKAHDNARRHTDVNHIVPRRAVLQKIEHLVSERCREIIVQTPYQRAVVIAPVGREHVDHDINQDGLAERKPDKEIPAQRSRPVDLRRIVDVLRDALQKRTRKEYVDRAAARNVRDRQRIQRVQPADLRVQDIQRNLRHYARKHQRREHERKNNVLTDKFAARKTECHKRRRKRNCDQVEHDHQHRVPERRKIPAVLQDLRVVGKLRHRREKLERGRNNFFLRHQALHDHVKIRKHQDHRNDDHQYVHQHFENDLAALDFRIDIQR